MITEDNLKQYTDRYSCEVQDRKVNSDRSYKYLKYTRPIYEKYINPSYQ